MSMNFIEGENRADIVVYALSTCGWCRKTKEYLKKNNVAFNFIDVDMCDPAERKEIDAVLKKWNPKGSFPTVVINDSVCIIGFDEDKLAEELKL